MVAIWLYIFIVTAMYGGGWLFVFVGFAEHGSIVPHCIGLLCIPTAFVSSILRGDARVLALGIPSFLMILVPVIGSAWLQPEYLVSFPWLMSITTFSSALLAFQNFLEVRDQHAQKLAELKAEESLKAQPSIAPEGVDQ